MMLSFDAVADGVPAPHIVSRLLQSVALKQVAPRQHPGGPGQQFAQRGQNGQPRQPQRLPHEPEFPGGPGAPSGWERTA